MADITVIGGINIDIEAAPSTNFAGRTPTPEEFLYLTAEWEGI